MLWCPTPESSGNLRHLALFTPCDLGLEIRRSSASRVCWGNRSLCLLLRIDSFGCVIPPVFCSATAQSFLCDNEGFNPSKLNLMVSYNRHHPLGNSCFRWLATPDGGEFRDIHARRGRLHNFNTEFFQVGFTAKPCGGLSLSDIFVCFVATHEIAPLGVTLDFLGESMKIWQRLQASHVFQLNALWFNIGFGHSANRDDSYSS